LVRDAGKWGRIPRIKLSSTEAEEYLCGKGINLRDGSLLGLITGKQGKGDQDPREEGWPDIDKSKREKK